MKVTDTMVYSVLRDMGVDVEGNKPPYLIPQYHGEYIHGYICSRCGKYYYWKPESCEACKVTFEKI